MLLLYAVGTLCFIATYPVHGHLYFQSLYDPNAMPDYMTKDELDRFVALRYAIIEPRDYRLPGNGGDASWVEKPRKN
jgi:hypothetical protein